MTLTSLALIPNVLEIAPDRAWGTCDEVYTVNLS
jgi:hypothetical protein